MSSILRRRWSLAILCGLVFAPACHTPPKEKPAPTATVLKPPPPPVVENPVTAAKDIFRVRCSVCHGEGGLGDGTGAAALNPKPRNFTDATWQASVNDEHIRTIIVKGGPAVGKSPGMAANLDLEKKPDVVNELVKIVRAFKK